jgi:UDP-glucose 4-epimerase
MVKVLITGGSGYIARAFRSRLSRDGISVAVASRNVDGLTLCPNETSVTYPCDWPSVLKEVDFLFHFSGLTSLAVTEADEEESYAQNVEPISQITKACQDHDLSHLRVVFTSTATVVGANPVLPVDEDTALNPITTYDRHKIEGEKLFQKASQDGILKAISLRLSNIYGHVGDAGSMNANRGVLNMMITRAKQGQDLTVFGDGNGLRDFLHIEDLVDLFISLMDCKDAFNGDSFYAVNGESIRLRDAFLKVAELSATGISIQTIAEPNNLHDIEKRNFTGYSNALQSLSGWKPKITFEQGILRELEGKQ